MNVVEVYRMVKRFLTDVRRVRTTAPGPDQSQFGMDLEDDRELEAQPAEEKLSDSACFGVRALP